MIDIGREVAGSLFAVMKKTPPRGAFKEPPRVLIEAGREGLSVRWAAAGVAVEYREPGRQPPGRILLPGEALADWRGREGEVSLTPQDNGVTLARWDDAGIPRTREYPAALETFASPNVPSRFVTQPGGLIAALRDAASVIGEPGRYALDRLQVRGGRGEVVATDGRILLVNGGFRFRFGGDVLVPASRVFGCRVLTEADEASVGITDAHLCVRAGRWTVWLATDDAGRFPPVEAVLPRPSANDTYCRLAESDARSLASALPKLSGGGPVTICLDGSVSVLAEPEGDSRATELTLEGSSTEGGATAVVCERSRLARMLALGFRSFAVAGAGRPVACREGTRTLVWMPLDPGSALARTPDAVRVRAAAPVDEPKVKNQEPEGRMNGRHEDPRPPAVGLGKAEVSGGLGSLLAEAERLKAELREAYGRSVRLVDALKRQRKHSRLVRSTLESLRQLPSIE